MSTLSKSKIIAFRQCPKRLWLEVHRPDLREDSPSSQARFQVGHQVGEIARKLYDPKRSGAFIDRDKDGFKAAFERTARLIEEAKRPIFEAGFRLSGTIAFADVMIPIVKRARRSWKMVEVKSSASVKDYHVEDVAVQSYLARGMGVELTSVAVAHVDSSWTYPGRDDYRGLLTEHDLTQESLELSGEVSSWLQEAHKTAEMKSEPKIETGDQCSTPFECGFCAYCNRGKILPEFPVAWLPRLSPKQRCSLKEAGIEDLRHVPDDMLRPKQRLVRDHTIQKTVFFDRKLAKATLKENGFPAYFLDFETTNPTVPIWKGIRPFQQIPFQFSLHKVRPR